MQQVFGKEWFKNPKIQYKLLWLLNHSSYFRKDLGIQECDLPNGEKITEITPNSFSYGDRYFMQDGKLMLERTTDFRTHNKFAKRLYYGFLPIWNLAHKFDMSVANRIVPAINLGFDTLTAYPVSGANSPVDGYARRDVAGGGESLSSIRSGAGTTSSATSTTINLSLNVSVTATTNNFTSLYRTAYCFDTSFLTSSASISAATMSLYGSYKTNTLGGNPEYDIVSLSLGSTDNVTSTDYANLGSTPFSSKTYNAWSSSAYNDFSLDSNGISNVNKTGVSQFGGRLNWDTDNSFDGTWAINSSTQMTSYSADYGANEPKLVVTYTLPASGGGSPHNMLLMGIG